MIRAVHSVIHLLRRPEGLLLTTTSYKLFSVAFKIYLSVGHQRLMPIIQATWEAEIRRIMA
jgi:hypothetical protein